MNFTRKSAFALLALLAQPVLAADFDGSKPILCATVATMDCVRGDNCLAGLPEDIGAPAFMRIDFAGKSVAGTKVKSDILLQTRADGQLLMQGREAGFGWTLAVHEETGELTATLVNRRGAYVLYGSCTTM